MIVLAVDHEEREHLTLSHISTKTSKPGPADFWKNEFGILETPSVHCMPYYGHGQPSKASN